MFQYVAIDTDPESIYFSLSEIMITCFSQNYICFTEMVCDCVVFMLHSVGVSSSSPLCVTIVILSVQNNEASKSYSSLTQREDFMLLK